ncbi:MAG TPA: TylF/MycF/NovP-related O-methyltransferase [Mycobacteriales bacterium]|jgi:hypothetical protein|nr:TylF/MycF/NovP-related O-methyltransferase [Mycobacteriales bacterium]
MTDRPDDLVRWGSADVATEAGDYFERSAGGVAGKLAAFPRFVDRTSISRFLVKARIFDDVLPVQGSIVECGVHDGGGLFTWAHLSALREPLNHRRKVIGFDTFGGFPSVHEADLATGSEQAFVGNYHGASREEIEQGIALFDRGRPLGQLPKIELVAGDFTETGPRYVADNPHLVVSLLYLDFDLYEPTRVALDVFLPLMPAGAVIAFDEVHVADFPGETTAMLEALEVPRLRLQRLPATSICWAVLTGDERR